MALGNLRRLWAARQDGASERVRAIDERIGAGARLDEVLERVEGAKRPLREGLREHLKDSTAATALTVKVLNLLLAKHQFARRTTMVLARPFGLLVDPANGCNLACPGCVQSTRAKSLGLYDWQNGMLTTERFAALLARYGPYAMQIMFCNYGEPILNANTPRLIAMAKSYYAQTALSTNLSVGKFDADGYVTSGLDFMYLAIDGASQGVYRRYRKNGDLDVVYRNVERLVEAKRRLGRRAPILRWQYLAFRHNAHEIPAALARAKELGVDQFVVEIPFDVSWDDPEIHPADVEPMQVELTARPGETLEHNWDARVTAETADEMERALERGWPRRGGEEAAPEAGHTCRWLYKSMTLDANGRILPCCGAPRPGVDVVFGRLGAGEADEFNSEPYRQARRWFGDPTEYEARRAAGGPAPYCDHCEWNQDHTEFGAGETSQYLRTVGRGALDAESIRRCAEW